MSLRIRCQFCGERSTEEFVFGGEARVAPAPGASPDAYYEFAWISTNSNGAQAERWFHDAGCRRWTTLTRNTTSNAVDAAESSDR